MPMGYSIYYISFGCNLVTPIQIMSDSTGSLWEKKSKRLLFAQQIRRRDRFEKLNQIRIDNSIREKAWSILSREQIDVSPLYQLLHQQKSNEPAVSQAVSQWFREAKRVLPISNKRDCIQWGEILCCLAEYDQSAVALVLQYLQPVEEHCHNSKDFEVVFLVMCSIMNAIQCTKQNNTCNKLQNIKQSIQEYAKGIVRRIMPLYHALRVGIYELKFYARFLRNYPEQSPLLCTNPKFLLRICNHLEAKLDEQAHVSEIFKIIIFVTYYDGQYYEGVTQQILQMKALEHIMFFLKLIDLRQWESALCQALIAIGNIVKSVGVQCVLETDVVPTLSGMIGEPQLTPSKLLQHCIQTYLLIVQEMENIPEQLEYMREENIFEQVLGILERYGEFSRQVEEDCYYAIVRILNIGQQRKQNQQVEANPYVIKLKYRNVGELFARFELFEGLMKKYGVEE